MRLFVKLFLVAFVLVIIDSLLNQMPDVSSEWMVFDCAVAAALGTLIAKRFGYLLQPPTEEFEFDIIDDGEYEEIEHE